MGGCTFLADMRAFSDWINSPALKDLQLIGASFTWCNHQSNPSMLRLDRFLVSVDWLDMFPHACQLVLPKPISDHYQIIIDSNMERWGPTPFRFELMWLEESKFSGLVRDWWKSTRIEGWAGFRLAGKLKQMKLKIKEWARAEFGNIEMAKEGLLQGIHSLDSKEELGKLSAEVLQRLLIPE